MIRFASKLLACLPMLSFLLLPGALWGQEIIVAFGDSITEGASWADEEKRGGYPSRLEDLLREAGTADARVHNEGLSSEKTAEGLSRIDSVIAKHPQADTFIIMEGTNDVTRIARGELSMESTVNNLEAMAAKVRAKAIVVLYSTIIPRPNWARTDSNNAVGFALVRRIRDLTSGGNRQLAEPWEVFENEGAPGFRRYYCCAPSDPVGHPNAAGFDLLAGLFADKLLGIDNIAPTVSSFFKTGSFGILRAGDRLQAIVHESGEGIRIEDTYFTVNGRKVDTDTVGSKRRLELNYQVAGKDVECAGRITVRTEDAAEPPNIRNRTVAELDVLDATTLKGDVNGDCRVDGFDLSLLGLSFGSKFGEVRYSELADANKDNRIDGDDLARLARNFGKSSS